MNPPGFRVKGEMLQGSVRGRACDHMSWEFPTWMMSIPRLVTGTCQVPVGKGEALASPNGRLMR